LLIFKICEISKARIKVYLPPRQTNDIIFHETKNTSISCSKPQKNQSQTQNKVNSPGKKRFRQAKKCINIQKIIRLVKRISNYFSGNQLRAGLGKGMVKRGRKISEERSEGLWLWLEGFLLFGSIASSSFFSFAYFCFFIHNDAAMKNLVFIVLIAALCIGREQTPKNRWKPTNPHPLRVPFG
jgi:hypothetical protein